MGDVRIQRILALIFFLAALIISVIGLTGDFALTGEQAWPLALISIILAIIFWVFGRKPPI